MRGIELSAMRVLRLAVTASGTKQSGKRGIASSLALLAMAGGAFIALLSIGLLTATAAGAQKSGGILRLYHNDTPPSASLLEESTIASVTPFAAVFNNLVVFDPAKASKPLFPIWPKAGRGTTPTRN
jgi:hypothetical protein